MDFSRHAWLKHLDWRGRANAADDAVMNLAHHIRNLCREHGTCGMCVDSAMDGCALAMCEEQIADWAYAQAEAGFPNYEKDGVPFDHHA